MLHLWKRELCVGLGVLWGRDQACEEKRRATLKSTVTRQWSQLRLIFWGTNFDKRPHLIGGKTLYRRINMDGESFYCLRRWPRCFDDFKTGCCANGEGKLALIRLRWPFRKQNIRVIGESMGLYQINRWQLWWWRCVSCYEVCAVCTWNRCRRQYQITRCLQRYYWL